MAKEDKSKEKEKDSTAVVSVNIEDFQRTRDSVIVSLATLQSAVSDLSRAYINHANTILNRGPSTVDLGGLTNSLLENGLLGPTQAAPIPGAQQQQQQQQDGTKKKRKRNHDPNAPKRALTPYFLFMQQSRAQIADEMDKNAKPKEVADEGARRWANMPDEEKQGWKKLYSDNLAIYHEKMKAYKAGEPVPEDTEAAAAQLQQGVDKAAEDSSEAEASSDDESEKEASPEQPKEPTPPPRSKRRRTGEHTKSEPQPSSPSTTKKPSPEKKQQSPEKKKKSSKEETKNETKPEAKSEKPKRPSIPETPKPDRSAKKKKSRKSDVKE